MTKKRTVFFIAAAAVLAAALVSYLCVDRIAIYLFAKTHDLDIAYKSFKNDNYKKFVFDDISVINKRLGIGLISRRAEVRPELLKSFLKGPAIDFALNDVRFTSKKTKDGDVYSYADLPGLVAAPFSNQWIYSDISGSVESVSGSTIVRNLNAVSGDIKLSMNGTFYKNDKVSADVVIYFSERFTSKIPPELSKVILSDEPDGWKSLSVKLSGDYAAPAIQVSSKLFRLKIATVYK